MPVDEFLEREVGERRHGLGARVVEHVAEVVAGRVALTEVSERPIPLDKAYDRGGFTLRVRDVGCRVRIGRRVVGARPRRDHDNRHAKSPTRSVRAGWRCHVIVPSAAVVPRDDHRRVAVVAARRVGGPLALHDRHVNRTDPSRPRIAERAGVVGRHPGRRDVRDLRKLAVLDVAEHVGHRRHDVLPIGAVPDMANRVEDVHPRVGDRIVGAGVVFPRHARAIEQIGDRRIIEARKDAGRYFGFAGAEDRNGRARFRIAAPRERIVRIVGGLALRRDQKQVAGKRRHEARREIIVGERVALRE